MLSVNQEDQRRKSLQVAISGSASDMAQAMKVALFRSNFNEPITSVVHAMLPSEVENKNTVSTPYF